MLLKYATLLNPVDREHNHCTLWQLYRSDSPAGLKPYKTMIPLEFKMKINRKKSFLAVVCLCVLSPFASAQIQAVGGGATIDALAVNGGAASSNAGVTCFKVSSAVSSICDNGYIAIKSNNKELISAVLSAKASKSNVTIYYEDNDATQHCPNLAMTKCTLSTIVIE